MADITLTYKGNTIAEISDSGSATLKTGGTYCEADIEVEYVKPSGGGVPPYVDVTIVSGVSSASIQPIRDAIINGSGFTSWYAKNLGTSPSSGFWLYGGMFFANDTEGASSNASTNITIRRATNGNVAKSTWVATGTVDAGTVFRVWQMYDYEAIYS